QKHQNGTEECVQEEFDGCVKFASAAPDADQEVHRNKHHFPKDVKEHEVERHENAHHSCLQDEHENVIFLNACLNRRPGRENCYEAQYRCKQNKQEADSIDA